MLRRVCVIMVVGRSTVKRWHGARRYPSDLSDPSGGWSSRCYRAVKGGRPEKHPRREIVDAILYVVRTGCAWRPLPADFPPWQTVYWYFARWEEAGHRGCWTRCANGCVWLKAAAASRARGSSIPRSVKGADTVGRGTRRGYDAGKKINGRKRFIVTDTLGLLITVMVCAASVQDRDGAKSVLLGAYLSVAAAGSSSPTPAFAGRLVEWAARILGIIVHIVRKPAGQKGCGVPRRWAVERTLAWLTAHRRLARDYERHPAHSEAMIRWAAINTMTRRLARGHPPPGNSAARSQLYLDLLQHALSVRRRRLTYVG